MVTIATFADISALQEMINSVYRSPESMKAWTTEAHLVGGARVSEDYLREAMRTPGAYILLDTSPQKEIWGCVYLEKHDRNCYLGLLSVRLERQQANVGKRLLNAAEAFARENMTCQQIEMTVIHQRPELIAYYQRRGYSVTGETRPFVGDHVAGEALINDLYFEVLIKKL